MSLIFFVHGDFGVGSAIEEDEKTGFAPRFFISAQQHTFIFWRETSVKIT